jgi:hypothetical protein
MMLMTKENWKQLPKLRAQDGYADPIAYVKFFFPAGRRTWYATEGDEKTGEMYGWVLGNTPQDDELGYFSLPEMEGVVVRGLKIERDRYFRPMPLSWAKNGERNPDKSGTTKYTVENPGTHNVMRHGGDGIVGGMRG